VPGNFIAPDEGNQAACEQRQPGALRFNSYKTRCALCRRFEELLQLLLGEVMQKQVSDHSGEFLGFRPFGHSSHVRSAEIGKPTDPRKGSPHIRTWNLLIEQNGTTPSPPTPKALRDFPHYVAVPSPKVQNGSLG